MTVNNDDKKIESFLNFLEGENALDSFYENLFKEHSTTPQRFLELTRQEDFIQGAFIWNNTLEGLHFWMKLRDKWDYIPLCG